jgi:hypothetical protein
LHCNLVQLMQPHRDLGGKFGMALCIKQHGRSRSLCHRTGRQVIHLPVVWQVVST